MKIQIHNGLRDVQTLPVTRVLVLDDFDNPIAVAVQVESGIILAETAANEAEFRQLLAGLGINSTFVVHDARERALPEIKIPQN